MLWSGYHFKKTPNHRLKPCIFCHTSKQQAAKEKYHNRHVTVYSEFTHLSFNSLDFILNNPVDTLTEFSLMGIKISVFDDDQRLRRYKSS